MVELHSQGYRRPDGVVRLLECGVLDHDYEPAGIASGGGESRAEEIMMRRKMVRGNFFTELKFVDFADV